MEEGTFSEKEPRFPRRTSLVPPSLHPPAPVWALSSCCQPALRQYPAGQGSEDCPSSPCSEGETAQGHAGPGPWGPLQCLAAAPALGGQERPPRLGAHCRRGALRRRGEWGGPPGRGLLAVGGLAFFHLAGVQTRPDHGGWGGGGLHALHTHRSSADSTGRQSHSSHAAAHLWWPASLPFLNLLTLSPSLLLGDATPGAGLPGCHRRTHMPLF